MSDTEGDLQRLRGQIDHIDRQLLLLLNERARCAQAVGQAKQGTPAYRPEREIQVLNTLAKLNLGPLSASSLQHIYRAIMGACLALEQQIRIAYLGPAGTFSHAAVEKHFGQEAVAFPYSSLDEVFRVAEVGGVDYAVVPVENSTEGAVGRTLDLMLSTTLLICGEIRLRIQQNLLSLAKDFSAINKIYSHAQSFAQCQNWLAKQLPSADHIPVSSNAEAVKCASRDKSAAAIASDHAALLYGLPILMSHIEDLPNNTTRFWILGKQQVEPTDQDTTSLVISAQNQPGAVYALLEPFAQHGVSMSRFESRPAHTGLWEYVFFVDLVGHQDDPEVAAALAKLSKKALFIKILGSYPKRIS